MHAYLWPHLLDLLRYFFGDPLEVTAAMVDDQALRPAVSAGPFGRPWQFGTGTEMLYHPSVAAAATFRYADPDFVATMSGSALVPLERNFWSFALYGSEDALVVDRATRANLNGVASLGKIAERIEELPACSYEESFALSVGGFVDAVLAGRTVPVTGGGADGANCRALGLSAVRIEDQRWRKTMRSDQSQVRVSRASASRACTRPPMSADEMVFSSTKITPV
jgi:predicted dehydrogenase